MSFFQKDKKAKSEKDHQQVDQLLEEASKELAGDPLQEAVQKNKNNHQ
ncbi:small acid-soluble spore protein SspJ [Bacillus altitudinis]